MNPQDPQAPLATNPQQQVIDRLRTAVNVLVTVSNNPTVDQLSAAIGITLLLNKMGKHATTVFSGAVPSTIEFLKPDETIEKNTDSLRDFIVSLDKSKADKLRYKVEQNVVKIFITPYHTSISEKDLEFSQGDFNVDAVLALGVAVREELDQAITAHGRILHDATVITVSAGSKTSSLGAVNWHDAGAASLCEMLVGISDTLQPNLIDTQEATAFLTGIVAQTDRFSNEKTTPKIMSLASQLMAAGANQQLIATQLDKATEVPIKEVKQSEAVPVASPENKDGALTIQHDEAEKIEHTVPTPPQDVASDEPVPAAQIAIDEHGNMSMPADDPQIITPRHRLMEPVKETEQLMTVDDDQASGQPFSLTDDKAPEASSDPLTHPEVNESATDSSHVSESPVPASTFVPAPDVPVPPPLPEVVKPETEILTLPPAMDDNTLHEIEKNLDSPHFVKDPTTTLTEMEEFVDSSHLDEPINEDGTQSLGGVDAARDAVDNAISAAPYDAARPQPLHALNATPLSFSADQVATPPLQPAIANDPVLAGFGTSSASPDTSMVLPPVQPLAVTSSQDDPLMQPDPIVIPPSDGPPPVPPPMMPLQ